jgi:crotonobetainyl-CoA:carnitine CoA-transferase CaiB-like acyl-CoA transferase
VAALVPAAAAGRRVEVSLVEAGVTSLVNVLANRLASGDEPRRLGNAHPNIAPYQAFEAGDGHLVVAVGNDAQFASLLEVLDLPADARFATNADRLANRLELTATLAAAIARHDRDELVAALRARDVPAGPVHSVGEALAAMQDAHGGAWLEEAGEMRLAPSPIRLDGERTPLRLAPPRLGQHSAELLAEAGYAPAQIAALIDSGVVRQA